MKLEGIRNPCVAWFVGLAFLLVPFLLAGCSDDGGGESAGPHEGETFLDVAREIADTWIQRVKPEQNDWSWGDGVLMFGMSELARRTGSATYQGYMQSWMDHHIQQGYYFAFSDNCPSGISAVRLFEETGEARYREVMDRVWYYLQHVAGRTSDNGLNHMGFMSGSQLWVDSLFMFGVYLSEMSRLLQDTVYWEELAEQIRVFSKHLRNEENGLFLHMWDDDDKRRVPEGDSTFWARGNAWVFVALAEFLASLPDESSLRQEFLPSFTKMAETLAELQPSSGLWHTVLYDVETYQETSASALLAYGYQKAMRLGILDATYGAVVQKTLTGLQSRLYRGCQGGLIVTGTSHGTNPGDRDHYAGITVGDQVPYGVGALLLATVELGNESVQGWIPEESECPEIPEEPESAEEYLTRAVYRLGIADLEGAQEDFQAMTRLDPNRGEGYAGEALLEAFFTGFEVFDGFTRYTIDEMSWSEFQEIIREETLPRVDRIRQKLLMARQDRGLLLHIPVLQINRRGLYTPIPDLRFDSRSLGGILLLLGLVETVFDVLS
jgi:unsaturated rhamnogalacturonyl hydrolase